MCRRDRPLTSYHAGSDLSNQGVNHGQPSQEIAQNQALRALLFLYREVLRQDLGDIQAIRAKRTQRLPTVMTREETLRVIGFLTGTYQLMAKLLCGCGLRLQECLQLRIQDVDFEKRQIIVRAGKGDKTGSLEVPPISKFLG
jgi:integrase